MHTIFNDEDAPKQIGTNEELSSSISEQVSVREYDPSNRKLTGTVNRLKM